MGLFWYSQFERDRKRRFLYENRHEIVKNVQSDIKKTFDYALDDYSRKQRNYYTGLANQEWNSYKYHSNQSLYYGQKWSSSLFSSLGTFYHTQEMHHRSQARYHLDRYWHYSGLSNNW